MRFCLLFLSLVLLAGCDPHLLLSPDDKNGGPLFITDEGYPSRWSGDSFPIIIRIPIDGFYDYELLALEDSMVAWNDAVGYKLFTVEWTTLSDPVIANGAIENKGVVVVYRDDLGYKDGAGKIHGKAYMRVWDDPPGELASGRIAIDNILKSHFVISRVFAHELGHALGLGHDPKDRYSIMHPYVASVGDVVIQQLDADYVRAMLPIGYGTNYNYSCDSDARRTYCPTL